MRAIKVLLEMRVYKMVFDNCGSYIIIDSATFLVKTMTAKYALIVDVTLWSS